MDEEHTTALKKVTTEKDSIQNDYNKIVYEKSDLMKQNTEL